MSLSPLCAARAGDLHVNAAAGLHRPFGRPRPGRAKITTFRVCVAPLGSGPVGARSLRPRPRGRGLAARRNSLIRVSRRAARVRAPRGPGASPRTRARDSSLASFERPPGAAFQRSLALLAALSDPGRIEPWGGGTPRVRAARSSSATAPPPRGATGLSPRVAGRSRAARPPPRPPARPRARLLPFRSPLLREPRLLSPPGLTDMLKFGPSSRGAGGALAAPPAGTPARPPPPRAAPGPPAFGWRRLAWD